MRMPRWTLSVAALVALVAGSYPRTLAAQGITTGAISGTVTNEQGQPLEGATVQAKNMSTGALAPATTRADGRYFIQGLESGGPYTVSVRRVGFGPQERSGLNVGLGQNVRADFQLTAQAVTLTAVTATAAAENAILSKSHTGHETRISDSTIQRLPTINRDFTDFAKLTPQVTTNGFGISAGGTNDRFNNIQIDGASNSDLFGLSSTPTPGGLSSAKSIPFDAVKEYQVLLSPFDVRQGSFTGLLVNAVTRTGTNDFHGSAFYYFRDSALSRGQTYIVPTKQAQYGATLGGPILRDKAFFYFAGEWQSLTQPSFGPSVTATGPSPDSPVKQDRIDAFNAALAKYGIDGGTGDAITRKNPNRNIFARVDANLPFNSRLALRYNYVYADKVSFSRSANGSSFPLTSNQNGITNETNSYVLQLFTNTNRGIYNEFLVSHSDIQDFRTVPVIAPEITVTVARNNSGTGTTTMTAGTEQSSQGNELAQKILEVTDNFTIPWRNHAFTIGTRNQFYSPDNLFARHRYGTWAFSSIDSLAGTCAACAGLPLASRYDAAVPVGTGDGRARFKAANYSLYVQDQWQTTDRLSLTMGARIDVPDFKDKPAENAAVVTEVGRHTSDVPAKRGQFSPRVGFNYDMTGDARHQLRGGAGLFSGPPPFVWLSNPYTSNGIYGFASFSCTAATGASRPPAFSANPASPPQSCAGGTAPALAAAINLTNPKFRFPQDFKASMGYDHRFTDGFLKGATGTLEGLYSHAVYAPFYENLALAGPQGTDRNGRVMYGTLTGTTTVTTVLRTGTSRTQILDVLNSNKDWAYNLTGSLQKRFSRAFEGSLAYTYSQARDVQSTNNSTAGSNWGLGRDVKDTITKQSLGRSKWEQPHRIIGSGTYTLPSKTDISFSYEGSSGRTYAFTYTQDLNADGRTGNDLIYVPKDVRDPNEILFTGYNVPASAASVANMQNAMDDFIRTNSCLANQRGRIMDRNSCRGPWNNLWNVSVRQNVSTLRGQNASIRLDVFNFANLLNKNWGIYREGISASFPSSFLLSRTGLATDAQGKPQGVFTLNTLSKYTFRSEASNYRMQLSVRYAF